MMEITAFAILMGIFALADVISTKTDAKLPALFIIAVLSVAGYWTKIIPTDIFALTGVSVTLVYLVYYLQLANMGALISLKVMLGQWRTVLIASAGLIGIVVGALLIGGLIFGSQAAIVGAAPLSGGIIAYEIMRQGAEAIGRPDLAIMALSVFVLQSFVGYPLTTFLLKKESSNLLSKYRLGEITHVEKEDGEEVSKKLLPQLPKKYVTVNTVLFKLAITGLVGIIITNFLNQTFAPDKGGDFISRYVILLIVGVILSEIGFLDQQPIAKSQIGGFTLFVIVGFAVIAGLARATPEVVFQMLIPTAGIMISGVIGLIVFSMIAGKFLGYSREMSIAVSLSALYGYPATELLSIESVKVVAENPEEYEYLINLIQPKMIIGGFTTVTFGSVFIAGILVNFL